MTGQATAPEQDATPEQLADALAWLARQSTWSLSSVVTPGKCCISVCNTVDGVRKSVSTVGPSIYDAIAAVRPDFPEPVEP